MRTNDFSNEDLNPNPSAEEASHTPWSAEVNQGKALPTAWGTLRVPSVVLFKGTQRDGLLTYDLTSDNAVMGKGAPTILGIAQGPVTQVCKTFRDKTWLDILASLPLMDRLGIQGVPWSLHLGDGTEPVVSSAFTGGYAYAALGYRNVAQFRCEALSLDGSGNVPDISWEVRGRRVAVDPGDPDAAARDVAYDLCTLPGIGLGLDPSQVQVDTGIDGMAASSFAAWCVANGFRVSGAVGAVTKKEALESLAASTFSTVTFSEGRVKFVPLGNAAIGGYVPPTPIALGVGDFGQDGLEIERVPEDEVYNTWTVRFDNRLSNYDSCVVQYQDAAHAAKYGVRRAEEVKAFWLKTSNRAFALAQLYCKASIHQRLKARFSLSPRWSLLEAGDLVSLTDPTLFPTGGRTFRLVKVDLRADGSLAIEAIETPSYSTKTLALTPQDPAPFAQISWNAGLQAQGTADTAYEVASGALVNANAAQATANAAQTTANDAQATANAAQTAATSAGNSAGARNRSFKQAIAPTNPTGGYPLLTGDSWANTDTTTNCPDTACAGRARNADGSLPAGAAPHGSVNWAHLWNGSAWKDAERSIVAREITAAHINASNFKVGYSEDGSGNPTSGVKIFDATVPLKIGPGGAKVGRYELSEPVVAALSALARSGTSINDVVWYRGNCDPYTNYGRPNIDRITAFWCDTLAGASETYFMTFSFTIQPSAASDNLDSLRAVRVVAGLNGRDNFSAYGTNLRYIPIGDRAYGYPGTTTDSRNASTYTFQMQLRQSAIWYINAAPFAPQAAVRMYLSLINAYGMSEERYFSNSTATNTLGPTNLWAKQTDSGSPPPPSGGGGGGDCPSPEVGVLLANGTYRPAGLLQPGDRIWTIPEDGWPGEYEVLAATVVPGSERLTINLGTTRLVYSPNHPVMTPNGWVAVKNLRHGDKVLTLTGSEEVGEVLPVSRGPVVRISTSGKTYITDGGTLNHNMKIL